MIVVLIVDVICRCILLTMAWAFKYAVDGKHKEYKEDPKRLHDGTIESLQVEMLTEGVGQ